MVRKTVELFECDVCGNPGERYTVTFPEDGTLSLDFWPLDYNLAAARKQWVQVRPMLACFEHWFGPYPWYEDGFKLIQVPNIHS